MARTKKKTKIEALPDFDGKTMSRNVEATRAYFFATAEHVLEGMQEQKIPQAPAVILTAALEFAAQVWMQTALQAHTPVQKARQTAEAQFRHYLWKYTRSEAARRPAPEQPVEGSKPS